MSGRQKKTLCRVALGGVLMAAAMVLPCRGIWRLAAFLIPYGVIGWDVLWRACRNIAHGQVFDENFLMALATLGAFCTGEYPEGVAVMLFYQIGELFQSYAVGKSRRSIAELMDIRPDYANLEREGTVCCVSPEEAETGSVIVIQPGERIPLDAKILEGESTLDTAALTGEAVPRSVSPGDEIISGCINQGGVLRAQVLRPFAQSTVTRILELVENAGSKKAKTENFITRFARWYTPSVVAAAVLLAVIPSLATGGWRTWIHQALVFLVISCPCALVISVPMSFFGGIGCASRHGVLVKGGSCLELLSRMHTVVFDKTGTLTRGTFRVTQILPEQGDRARLLELAALAETYSTHPISRSLREAYGKEPEVSRLGKVEELPGRGISAEIDGEPVYVGNRALMESLGLAPGLDQEDAAAVVYVAAHGEYQGCIAISDQVKPDAAEAIARLKALGVQRTVMLTGDRRAAAEKTAASLGIDRVQSQLLPAEKVEQVERLLADTPKDGKLAFVGDGINDAPVLSRADLGIAMGGMGSDAAIEAADVVLMDDKPSKLPDAVLIAKGTLRIVRQNIVFALAVKGIILVLGALGAANMWEAVFADVGVAVLAILNAMRALKIKTAA